MEIQILQLCPAASVTPQGLESSTRLVTSLPDDSKDGQEECLTGKSRWFSLALRLPARDILSGTYWPEVARKPRPW